MRRVCLSSCRQWHFNTVCSGGATLYCQPVSQSVTLAESCCYLLTAACYHLFQAQPEFMTAKRGERPMGFLPLTSATGAATVSQLQCRDASWWPGLALRWKGTSRENREKNNLKKKTDFIIKLLMQNRTLGKNPMLPLPSHCSPQVWSDLLTCLFFCHDGQIFCFSQCSLSLLCKMG